MGLHVKALKKGEFLLAWTLPAEASMQSITYRLWVTTTDHEGKKHATILAERLETPQCRLLIEDFEEATEVEFGVEAVNRFGVSTPCVESLTFQLPVLKQLVR